MTQDWQAFECEIMEAATAIKQGRSHYFDVMSPTDVQSDLRKIDRAMTEALQVLLPLKLRHHENQDLETEPFNYQVVFALQHGNVLNDSSIDANQPQYPTEIIEGIIGLRDAARRSLTMIEKPRRGNSSMRTEQSALTSMAGNNFVFKYRSRFGEMPPITKNGIVVDLLDRMLRCVGVLSVDAADVLRRAIERDEVGRSLLPSASDVATNRRPKYPKC